MAKQNGATREPDLQEAQLALHFLQTRLYEIKVEHQETIRSIEYLHGDPEADVFGVQVGTALIEPRDREHALELLVRQKDQLRQRIATITERIRLWGMEINITQARRKGQPQEVATK